MSPSPSSQPTNSSFAPEAYYWQADDDWATNMEDMQKYEAIFTTDRTLSCTVSSLSIFAGLFLVGVIISTKRRNRLSQYDQLILAITIWELIYDASIIMEQPINYKDNGSSPWATESVTPGRVPSPSLVYAADFLGTWSLMESFLFSNVLSVTVWYVVFFRKKLRLVHDRLFLLGLGIVALCFIPAALRLYADYHSAEKEKESPAWHLKTRVYDAISTSVWICIAINILASVTISFYVGKMRRGAYIRVVRSEENECEAGGLPSAEVASPSTSNNTVRKRDLLRELTKRLALIPLIQAICQFPFRVWNYYYYYNILHSERGSRHSWICEWKCMASPGFQASLYLSSATRPLAGLLFAIVYVAFQHKAKALLWIVFSSTWERMAQFFRRRNTEAEPVGNSGNRGNSGSSSNSTGNSTGEIPQALEDDPSPTAKGSSTLSASAGSWALGSPLKTSRDGRNRPSRSSSSRSSRQTLERLSDEALVQLIQDSHQQQEVQGASSSAGAGAGAGGGGGEEVPGVDAIPNPMRVADSAVETHEEL